MHRSIEITASSAMIDSLLPELLREEHVLRVARQPGISVQPPGSDVVTVHALNRGTDAVMMGVGALADI